MANGFVRSSLLAAAVCACAALSCSGPVSDSQADEYLALDSLAAAEKPVVFNFVEMPLVDVFEAVAEATGVEIEVESGGDRKITVRTGKTSFKDALVQMAEEHGLEYEVTGEDRLIVRSKTREGAPDN